MWSNTTRDSLRTHSGDSAHWQLVHQITRSLCLKQGDSLVGHGPLVRGNKIIYVMRISDVLGYDKYYTDPRFAEKKADAGCWQKRCGDNIYYSDREGRWRQATSYFHTKPARESSDDGTLTPLGPSGDA